MADLSTLTDQERALLAQYLAVKAGGTGNAPALLQMILDRLGAGTFGSTLAEVVYGLLPDGIPMGTDFSAYLPFVQGGAAPVLPQQGYGDTGSSSGGESSVGDPFDWSGYGQRARTEQPAVAGPIAEPAPAPAAAGGSYPLTPRPLFPDLPRRDPRSGIADTPKPEPIPDLFKEWDQRISGPTPVTGGGDLGAPVAGPDPLSNSKPAAVAPQPPEVPLTPSLIEAATGFRFPHSTALPVPAPLNFDPPDNSQRLPEGQAGMPVGRPIQSAARPEVIPASFDGMAATPGLDTRVVQPFSINPNTGQPVDFGKLLSDVQYRDLTGPLADDTDRGISLMSMFAPRAVPRASTVTDFNFNAVRPERPGSLPAARADIAPITEQQLDDWIEQQGLRDEMRVKDSDFPPMREIVQQPTTRLAPAATREPVNTVYAPVPAPLPLARMAVAAAVPEGVITLSDNDREMLARAVATEVDPRIARTDPAAYQQQVYRTLDVMLNRVASGQFADGVEGVLNQPRQFSAITGPVRPGREHFGNVENIPATRADPELRNLVNAWLDERAGGAPSSVGGALHYANPQAADASNMRWIEALDGPRDDAGPFSHWYGTTDGFTPVEAVLSPARDAANGLAKGQSWLTTKPQTPISTTAAVQAEKLRTKSSVDFNLAVQAAAQAQQREAQTASKIAQSYTPSGGGGSSSTGEPFNYDKQAAKQANAPGGGSQSSVGAPFTPTQTTSPTKTSNSSTKTTTSTVGGGATTPKNTSSSSSGSNKTSNTSSSTSSDKKSSKN